MTPPGHPARIPPEVIALAREAFRSLGETVICERCGATIATRRDLCSLLPEDYMQPLCPGAALMLHVVAVSLGIHPRGDGREHNDMAAER